MRTTPALYCAPVIEIPPPGLANHDAVRFALGMPPQVPLTTRERACISPTCYKPRGSHAVAN